MRPSWGYLWGPADKREPVQRATFLNEACGGDDSLRQEVESLLTQEEVASNTVTIFVTQ